MIKPTYPDNGIITIAIGKKYVSQAKFLAYSCMLNSPHILRAVVTDLPDSLINYYDIIIPYNNTDDPFSLKTRLYDFSPFENTLFLDADSLVFNSIDSYFPLLKKSDLLYFGNKITQGEWYFDINKALKTINCDWVPKFNSGMLLFNKNEITKQIFNTAHYYFFNHHKEGIEYSFFRGNNYPDEPAFSIALAKYDIEPFNDYGRFSRSLIKTKSIHLNVIKRISFFLKNDVFVHPLVVHFCGRKGGLYYLREKIRLFLQFKVLN